MPGSAERLHVSGRDWPRWKDDQEMVLLSEGGHNTGPHTDSEGKATWITVQEGRYLILWLANPSKQERDDWMADPSHYTGGQWRYKVLRHGESVLLPSGLIHAVSRSQMEQTLCYSGHILQWTGITQWIDTIALQKLHPHITNESFEWTESRACCEEASRKAASTWQDRVF